MRKCVLYLLVLNLVLGLSACTGGPSAAVADAPELLKAVPSDALCAGLYSRLDKGVDRMLDSTNIVRSIEFGKLARSRSVIALCDVGSIEPLVIVEAGKASADTSSAAASVLAQADSIGVSSLFAQVGSHNVLLLSPSETALTVARRNVASQSSILDAPEFDRVVSVLPSSDVVVYRSRGSHKLFVNSFSGPLRSEILAFLREASEWMVFTDDRIVTVQPEAERYWGNFCSSQPLAPVKLGSVMPDGTLFYVDIPVTEGYRVSYELWLDARVALESYNRRIAKVWNSGNKDPRQWEKELGVAEAAVAYTPYGTLNLLRVKDKGKTDGVAVNPRTGFVRALYGSIFNDADSCMIRSGNWIISGSRAALENYEPAKADGWPSKAKVVAGGPGNRFVWNKDNSISIWDSNR
ncbi:MAG: hypothetical protein IKZ91_00655 [Bacteroidales bacterium]|nr:hypothetical protein [Bacteroidales bacterium]